MLCVPDYTVIYKGTMHNAGVAFRIEEADEAELACHGKIINDGVAEDTATPIEKKPGRPRKKA